MFEALHLHLTTSATSYKPGDTVIALLQASSGASPVELLEVELQFAGVERVDTSWVSPAYRKDVAPINADKRHLQRHVVFSRLQAATQGTLGGSRFRKFVVRCEGSRSCLGSCLGCCCAGCKCDAATCASILLQPKTGCTYYGHC